MCDECILARMKTDSIIITGQWKCWWTCTYRCMNAIISLLSSKGVSEKESDVRKTVRIISWGRVGVVHGQMEGMKGVCALCEVLLLLLLHPNLSSLFPLLHTGRHTQWKQEILSHDSIDIASHPSFSSLNYLSVSYLFYNCNQKWNDHLPRELMLVVQRCTWMKGKKEGEREKVGLIWWWIREQCFKLALHLPSPFYAFSLTFLPFLFSHSLPLLPPPPILLVPSLSLTLLSLSCILRVTAAKQAASLLQLYMELAS